MVGPSSSRATMAPHSQRDQALARCNICSIRHLPLPRSNLGEPWRRYQYDAYESVFTIQIPYCTVLYRIARIQVPTYSYDA
eukprot:COSAG02_NODE_69_length_42323_cov_23.507850_40_plen_81_part_00